MSWKNWAHAIVCILLLALSGCISQDVVPTKLEPSVPAATLHARISPAQPLLECLSEELAPYAAVHNAVGLGQLRNSAGDKLGESTLPKDIRAFVRKSLSRITSAFDQYDGEPVMGPNGQLATAFTHNIPRVIIEGELTMAEERASVLGEVEALGLGGSGKVRIYELESQLYALDGQTRAVLTPAVTLTMRIVVAENGVSFFHLAFGDYVRGQLELSTSSPIALGLQELVDASVARVLRDLAAEQFPTVSIHVPESCGAGVHRPIASPVWPVQAALQGGQACLIFSGPGGQQSSPIDQLEVTLRQYRGRWVQTAAPQVAKLSRDAVGKRICFAAGTINNKTESVELELDDGDHSYAHLGLQRLDITAVRAGAGATGL